MVNDFEIFATFAECFVISDWWSPESPSTHCNLLVFFGFLLMLLLLYLHIVASWLFELTAILQCNILPSLLKTSIFTYFITAGFFQVNAL